jgi:hypothetical protein
MTQCDPETETETSTGDDDVEIQKNPGSQPLSNLRKEGGKL